jgi:hypothetical protein
MMHAAIRLKAEELVSKSDSAWKIGTLVIGAGPGGLAPLLSALLDAGLIVVDRGDRLGDGAIGDYAINSDSSAETFLSAVDGNPDPVLAAAARTPEADALRPYGKGAVPLKLVGRFMRQVGLALRSRIDAHEGCAVLCGQEAVSTQRLPDGRWLTVLRSATPDGVPHLQHIVSSNLIVATGASQPVARMAEEQVAGLCLGELGGKLLQSGDILTDAGAERVRERIAGRDRPRIVVIGGSTSAASCAYRLLSIATSAQIDILCRDEIRIFYPSRDAARADGYVAFDDTADVCPISGFVFRFGGMRFDNRDLMMRCLGIGGHDPEPRLRLYRLRPDGEPDPEARSLLQDADLVVAALGYRPHGLPVLDEEGQPLSLLKQAGWRAPMVGEDCGILDANGNEIPGLFGIGLAAGFNPCPRMGGEPSFRGQANGLWLWQNDIGRLVVKGLLSRLPASSELAAQAA